MVVVVVRRPSPNPLKKINWVISLSGVLLLRGQMVENNRDRTGCTNMPPHYYQLHLFGNPTTPHRLMLDGSSIIDDQTKLRHHIRSVIFTGKQGGIPMKKRFLSVRAAHRKSGLWWNFSDPEQGGEWGHFIYHPVFVQIQPWVS